jgi:hypothetical protein
MELFSLLATLCPFVLCFFLMNECEGMVFLYRLEEVNLLGILGKHHMQLPPRALNALAEKGGARRSWGQCGRTQGVAAPWAAHLVTTFGVWAPG